MSEDRYYRDFQFPLPATPTGNGFGHRRKPSVDDYPSPILAFPANMDYNFPAEGSRFHQTTIVRPGDFQDLHIQTARKRIDPRLVTLLEIFKRLYGERRDLFNKIFPELHGELEELLKNVHEPEVIAAQTARFKILQRSLSTGSPHTPLPGEDPLRIERFKIKTFDIDSPNDGKPVQGFSTKPDTKK